jgi:hypothetical protein
MVKVIANTKGFIDGQIREMGERFNVDDELWADEKRRPKWVREARKTAIANEAGEPQAPAPAGEKEGGEPEGEGEQKAPGAPQATGKAGKAGKGNGVQEELGGPAPDWLPPGDGAPQPVAD